MENFMPLPAFTPFIFASRIVAFTIILWY